MKPTERFSTRVEVYRRYRPGYPEEIAGLLERECGLTQTVMIADVAAGTGLLSEIFLERGYAVDAIEPNASMRAACETLCERWPRLRCSDGTAEATGLPDRSADLITVAQAMHWFDLARTRKEFARVLRPGGWCAVIYNHRRMGGDGFHDGYEQILREFGGDYLAVQERHMTPEKLAAFFAPSVAKEAVFPNAQRLTLEGLEGRIVSSSYMPQAGEVRYVTMREAIERLFEKNERDGVVTIEYECSVVYGQLSTR
ncbi:class I SAM-dependent methyltransferase [Paracidobacterium acidisoli]|nr:class I SAM-dependent methyltransferase [Paracidobacterium acidisoli]MBT9331693.1 class I SAM-dependent methyltransferase [Paracidobacterium acidisoli]